MAADHFKQNGDNEMISGFKLVFARSALARRPLLLARPLLRRHPLVSRRDAGVLAAGARSTRLGMSLAGVDLMRVDVCCQRRETECRLACT